jgi:hypothetical protein
VVVGAVVVGITAGSPSSGASDASSTVSTPTPAR